MGLISVKPEGGPASAALGYGSARVRAEIASRDTRTAHLAVLVPVVRARLEIDDALPDQAIIASLRAIAACAEPRERWRAAFDSNLGHWLALKGSDLNTALNILVGIVPKTRF